MQPSACFRSHELAFMSQLGEGRLPSTLVDGVYIRSIVVHTATGSMHAVREFRAQVRAGNRSIAVQCSAKRIHTGAAGPCVTEFLSAYTKVIL